MGDVRTMLDRASHGVSAPVGSWERLRARRDRARRRHRVGAMIVAGVVGVAGLAGVVLMAGLTERSDDTSGAGWHPTRDLSLRAGEYFYLRIESSEAVDGHIRDERTWWGVDGSGEVRNDGSRQDKYPYPPSGIYGEGDFPTWRSGVSSLSTDPSTLAAQLRDDPSAGGGGPEAERLWDATSFLVLETPYATPELRAALFEVASDVAGVTVTMDDRDPVGRPAIGLSFSDGEDGSTWTMYFDAGTHQPMAWTFTSERGGEGWEVLESGIVDAVGRRPTGDQWLAPPLPSETP